jgi:hypothetical protein
MKTTAKTDIVNYVLGLFATLVLLLSWPRGKKGGPQKWTIKGSVNEIVIFG